MKATRYIPLIALLALASLCVVFADGASPNLSIRFAPASEVYDAIKQQLGPKAAAAVTSVDTRGNFLKIDSSHPDAAKVRELATKLDRKPQSVKIAATVLRVISPATPTEEAVKEVLSRPSIIGRIGHPMTLGFGDPVQGAYEIELIVTPDQ